MCGSAEIESHAFCLGLDYLGTALEESTIQVTFLIRETIFRSRVTPRDQDRLSLDICSLGELVDMYHAYKATRLHDKLYALLGMCSDDLKVAGLEPNYDLVEQCGVATPHLSCTMVQPTQCSPSH